MPASRSVKANCLASFCIIICRIAMSMALPTDSQSPQVHVVRGDAGFDYTNASARDGKDRKRDQGVVRDEGDRGAVARFGGGLPRISDGQLRFVPHMFAHAWEPAEGGSRVDWTARSALSSSTASTARGTRLRPEHRRRKAQTRRAGRPRAHRASRHSAPWPTSPWRARGRPPRSGEEGGRKQRRAIGGKFGSLPHRLFLDGVIFGAEFSHGAGNAKLRVAAPIRRAILGALCERNAEDNCRDRDARRRSPWGRLGARDEAPRPPHLDCHDAPGVQNGEVGLLGWESNLKRCPSTSTARLGPLEGTAVLREMSG